MALLDLGDLGDLTHTSGSWLTGYSRRTTSGTSLLGSMCSLSSYGLVQAFPRGSSIPKERMERLGHLWHRLRFVISTTQEEWGKDSST
jgi:hypothetical protein